MHRPAIVPFNRREVIELGVISAGSGVLSGCSGVVREDVRGEPTDPRRQLPRPLVAILHDAALAPSSHNSQPWLVANQRRRLAIFADVRRRLPDVDPDGRELRLSLGAFVENLVVAAGARGLASEVEVATAGDLDRPIADVRLHAAPPSREPLALLERRCTVRRGLRSTPLSGALIRLLVGEPGAAAIHFVPGGAPLASSIREATVAAFAQQTRRDSAQRELARWIRFSNGAARARRDGLTTASMGIDGVSGWFVRNFYDQDDVMKSSFRRRGIEATAKQVREGSGWFVVVSRDQRPESIFEAGRAYERLALRACHHRVGLHPMSQSLEEGPYQLQLPRRLGLDGVPQFIVRAGLVDTYPEPATLRRPVRDFAR